MWINLYPKFCKSSVSGENYRCCVGMGQTSVFCNTCVHSYTPILKGSLVGYASIEGCFYGFSNIFIIRFLDYLQEKILKTWIWKIAMVREHLSEYKSVCVGSISSALNLFRLLNFVAMSLCPLIIYGCGVHKSLISTTE